ncbi:MAG: hypothetical protein AB7G93_15700 [Bdellovibrionales bacterium]
MRTRVYILGLVLVMGWDAGAQSGPQALWDWANDFHRIYMNLSDSLPGHEASVWGRTDKGEICRFGIYREGNFLELSVILNPGTAKEIYVGTTVCYDYDQECDQIKDLKIGSEEVHLETIKKSRTSRIGVRGKMGELVDRVTATSPSVPQGVTCQFQAIPTS